MNHVDHPKALTHISLCAGYGGIDLGLTRALGAVRTVAFSEIEAFPCANLVAKMEKGLLDVAPIWTDLKTFPWEQFRGSVDVLSGGFPCQPFSAAGRRAGDDDPRHLWPHIVRGIRELGRPPLVFFENVEGILSSKLNGDQWSDEAGTPVLLHVLRELERLGYQATAGVFSAREIGAPHQRKRVFILGTNLNSAGRDIVNGRLDNVGDTRSEIVQRPLWASAQGASVRPPCSNRVATAYPAPRGAEQYEWEPPRTTKDGDGQHIDNRTEDRRLYRTAPQGSMEHTPSKQSERPCIPRLYEMFTLSSLPKRTAYPAPRGADQYDWEPPRVTVDGDGQLIDNRTDELRLLGNGVVPDTAARAFRELFKELANT